MTAVSRPDEADRPAAVTLPLYFLFDVGCARPIRGDWAGQCLEPRFNRRGGTAYGDLPFAVHGASPLGRDGMLLRFPSPLRTVCWFTFANKRRYHRRSCSVEWPAGRR